MDQNALLAALLQGGGTRQLMMNPAPALAGLPGAGQISAPMMQQQSPPPAMMDATSPHSQMGMQHMLPPAPPPPDQSGPNALAKGIASFGSPLGQFLGKPGETPTATNTLLQMMFGSGAQGGLSGLMGLLK